MIDVHSHLADARVFSRAHELINEARVAGVKAIIISATKVDEIERARSLAERYRNYVYVTVGQDVASFSVDDMRRLMSALKEMRSSVVGIGEIGLDYRVVRDELLREISRTIFIEWLKLSRSLDLPVVIHSRRACSSVLQLLSEMNVKNVVLHAFSCSRDAAREAVERGYYFSIPPSISYSRQKRELVKMVPLEQILTESDTPELGPSYGVESKPSHVKIVVEKISEVLGVPPSSVVEVTTENAIRVFKLKVLS